MLLLSVFLATLSLAVGVFSYVVSHVPGARRNLLPSTLFVAACVYAISDALGYVPGIPDAVRAYIASLAFAAGGFFVLGAIRYVAAVGGHDREWTFKVLRGALYAAIVACLVPGAVYSSLVEAREIAFLHEVYFDTQPTGLGSAVFGVYFGSLLIVLARMLGDWRRGVRFASYYAVAFGAVVAAALCDLAVVLDVSRMPYVLTEGIFLAAVVFAAAIVREINEDRVALQKLRVELEQRVFDRTRELERRTEELARAERMVVVGRLAAGIAHELNNPAAAIRASLEDARTELLRRTGGAEVLACIDISLAAVDRVSRIVRQFGAMAGGAEAEGRAVSGTNLARGVRAAVAATCDGSRPEISVNVAVDEGFWVRGLATAVEEAASAIIRNAVEAIPDGRAGHVDVAAQLRDEWVELTVRDSGEGMREDLVARAFEPFFTTKELGHSSGLGLPVAKGLVETMGGTLSLRSIPGVGSEATIRLRVGAASEISGPRARPADAVEEQADAPAVPRRVRVLLVDDDDLVRAAMTRYLSRVYDVDAAGSVREGLDLACREHDVIISDVVMPQGGGQRLMQELLARDPDLAARIIFITGGSFRGDLQEFLLTQGQPVLNKPVRLSELKAAIARLSGPPATG